MRLDGWALKFRAHMSHKQLHIKHITDPEAFAKKTLEVEADVCAAGFTERLDLEIIFVHEFQLM
jgi:hypothetical protein